MRKDSPQRRHLQPGHSFKTGRIFFFLSKDRTSLTCCCRKLDRIIDYIQDRNLNCKRIKGNEKKAASVAEATNGTQMFSESHLAYYFLHFSVKNTNRSVGFIIEGNTKLLNLYHLVCRSQSEYSEHQEWVTLWMGYTRKRVNRFNDVGRQGRSVLEEKHKTFDGYSKSLTVLILGKIISGTTNFNN